tara:strand:- start:4723 stop:5676 length:954 start_codon:yes stop_codon:yes gene_type:complete
MSNLYFYHGTETFLVDEAVNNIKSQHTTAQLSFFEKDYDINTIIEKTQSTGLFATTNLIILKNPLFLTKTPSKEETAQWLTLFNSIKNPNTLIIYTYGTIDLRKKLASTLSKQYQSQRFEPFKEWEDEKFMQWIKARLTQNNYQISPDALNMLCQISNKNLQHCTNDINNIITYIGNKNEINIADIKAMCTIQQSNIYKLTESIKKRNYQDCFKSFQHLNIAGEEPVKLIGLLTSNFRFFIQLLLLQKEPESSIAKKLGKHPFFIKQTLNQIKKTYTVDHIKIIIKALANLDYQIKSGTINAKIIFSSIPKTICLRT